MSGPAWGILQAVARDPRPAGGEAEAGARAWCRQRLEKTGFSVVEEPFEYSAFVGKWATPLAGVVALATLSFAAFRGRDGDPATALTALTLGAMVLSALGIIAARRLVLSFPALRRKGVNLVATRGAGEPAVWLVAHLDSKSQPVPILMRAAAITVVAIVWMAGLALAVAQSMGAVAGNLWDVVALGAFIGAIPVIATTVGARSPGALDNASGVATVLLAATALDARPVGVLLTSAEELGLAGARAWTRGRGAAIAINCDGVDDEGRTTCMYSGRRPTALVNAILEAAERAGVRVRPHRLLPGILTDGVALADAGWQVVTMSRGDARTLARIHTPADHLDALRGSGAVEVARVVSFAAERLLAGAAASGGGV